MIDHVSGRSGARALTLTLLAMLPLMAGCKSASGATLEERQDYVLEQEHEVLDLVDEKFPDLSKAIDEARGYGVFSYSFLKLPLIPLLGFGGGGGFGVVTDAESCEKTFMNVRRAEWGWGLGYNDLALVLVFRNEEQLAEFMKGGRQWQAGAEASLAVGDVGAGFDTANIGDGDEVIAVTLSRKGINYGLTLRTLKFSTW